MIDRRGTLLASLAAAAFGSSGAKASAAAVSDHHVMQMLISKFLITLNLGDFDALFNQLPEGYVGGKGTFGDSFSTRYGMVDYFRKVTTRKQQYRAVGNPSVLSDYVAVQLVEVANSEEPQASVDSGPLSVWEPRPLLFAFSFSRKPTLAAGPGDLIIERVSVVDTI